MRLTVNAQGKASFCEAIEYTGSATFADTACLQLLRHATFEPARGADGEARSGFFQTRVIYHTN